MGVLKKLWNKVSNWFSGGSSNSSSSANRSKVSSANRTTNYGGRTSTSSGSNYGSSRSAFQAQLDEEERKRQERIKKANDAFKASEKKAGQSTETTSSKPKTSKEAAQTAFKAKKTTAPDPKEARRKESAEASRERLKESLRSYNKATKDKYNVDKNGIKARQAQKSQAYDVEAEKWETKNHKVATSAARGALSGVTMGASEMLLQNSKNRKKSGAEETYQKNKSRGAEIAGEVAGSLAGFGLTGGASKAVAKKVGNKAIEKGAKAVGKEVGSEALERLGGRATARLAENNLVKKAAQKELDLAIKKGAVKVGSDSAKKELLKELAENRAKRIVSAVGEDAAINLTTGAMSDVNHAILESDNPEEFAKNMGVNAAINVGLGGLTSVAPALRTRGGLPFIGGVQRDTKDLLNRRAAREGLDDLIRARRAGAAVGNNLAPPRIGESVENRLSRDAMERTFANNADRTGRIDMGELLARNGDELRPPQRAVPEITPQTVEEAIQRRRGFHAGDGGRAEWYGNQAGSRRDTGHYGTGTYFAGSEDILARGGYGNRPLNEIDFTNYNLYRPQDSDQGFRVHDRLKQINRGSNDMDSVVKRVGVTKADATAMLNDIENATTREELEAIASRLYSRRDMEAIEEAAEKRLQDWNEYNAEVARNRVNGVDDLDNIDDILAENIDLNDIRGLDEALNRLEPRYSEYIEDATYDNAYLTELRESLSKELQDIAEYGGDYEGFVEGLAKDLGASEEQIRNALERTREIVSQYADNGAFLREDSASTIFMKELGYEGVDVTGLEGLDNTEFGSVIYNLRPEDMRQIREGKPRNVKAEPPAKTEAPKAERERLRQEYLDLKAELKAEWDRFNAGDRSVNAWDLEKRAARLDELDSQIRALDRGETPTPSKATPPAEKPMKVVEPTAKPTEVAPEATPKVSELQETKSELPPAKEADNYKVGRKKKRSELKLTPKEEVERAKREKARFNKKLDREFEEVQAQLERAVKEQGDENVGVRKSILTAEKIASTPEKQRLIKEGSDLLAEMRKNGMSVDANSSILNYRRFTKERRDELIKEGYQRAAKDTKAIYNKLKAKVDADESITLTDIADMIGIRRVYANIGGQVPAEIEETFTRVVAQGQTEHAQLLKVTDLLLREHDPNYKRRLISKDLDRFRDIVCNAKDWEKISASLDASHGIDGYLDKRIAELVKFKGSPAEFKKQYTELCKEIYRNSEPTLWEALNLVRHTFMLGALKTADNNLLGNLMQRGMYSLSDKLTIAAEHMLESRQTSKIAELTTERTRLTEQLENLAKDAPERKELKQKINELGAEIEKNRVTRTTAMLENKDLKKLAWEFREGKIAGKFDGVKIGEPKYKDKEFAELFHNQVHEAVDEAMGDSKFGFHADKGSDYVYVTHGGKAKKIAVKAAEKGSKAVGFMLNEPDRWFVESSYRMALAKYLQANGITTAKAFKDNSALVKKASEHAMDVALENTYKKANRLVTILERQRAKGYREGSSAVQKLATLGLDAELPYLKVPVNMVVNNFKYSPANALKSGIDALGAAKKGDIEGLQKAVNELSKGLTGTGLAALGFILNCEDQEDENAFGFIADARDELKEYNVRDNSIMLNGVNYNIANLGIGATQLLMGASFAEQVNQQGGAPSSLLDNAEAVLGAFNTTFDVISDMSLLDNVMGIFDAVGNQGDYEMGFSERGYNIGAKVASDYVGQLTPAPIRAIARGTTNADLDTNVKKGSDTSKWSRTAERNINNLVSNVPIVNEKVLAHKVDRHGNLINEKKNGEEKALSVAMNFSDPFNRKSVNIPKADKVELAVKDDNGNPYQPKHFDEDRTFKADIGKGQFKETIDLTRKEREQAARSVKKSGRDMAESLVYAKHGWFGDSHGERAQQILKEIPEDEEKAREYLYNTKEFKSLKSDDERKAFMDELYKGSGSNVNTQGRERTSNRAVYVDIKGGDEGDFNFLNDLSASNQKAYANYDLESAGVTKGEYAEAIEAMKWASHKFKDDGTNVDTINAKGKIIEGILSLGLSKEKNIAIYNATRGNRPWKDWDGESDGSYHYSRGWRRRSGYGRRSGRKGSSKTSTMNTDKPFEAKKPSVKAYTAPKMSIPTAKSSVGSATDVAAVIRKSASRSAKGGKVKAPTAKATSTAKRTYKSMPTAKSKSLSSVKLNDFKVTPPKAKKGGKK